MIAGGGHGMSGFVDDPVQRGIATDHGGCRRTRDLVRRAFSNQQFVEHDPEREDVRPAIGMVRLAGDLRRGVARRAHDDPGVVGARRAGQAEVADLRLRLGREQNVRRLDVAVNDPVFVGVGQAVANAFDDGDGLDRIDRAVVGGIEERLAVHQLHHDVRHAVGIAKIIDANQVRMIEAGHRLGLAFEGLVELRVLAELARQDLDRDIAVEAPLASPVHGSHPALGDESMELIGRQERG